MTLINCNSILPQFGDVGNAHVILASHLCVQGAFRKVELVGQATTTLVMMTLTSLRTVQEIFPERDLSSLCFFREKNRRSSISVRFFFFTNSNADPGMWSFCEKNLSITTIPTINNIKFEGIRVVWGYQL